MTPLLLGPAFGQAATTTANRALDDATPSVFKRLDNYALGYTHAGALDSRIAGCEWADGFKFSDFVRTRIYESLDVKSFTLPGVLRHCDVDEL